MERRNDAFDEFLIDPVPQAAHSSLSLSERFSVTNALSEKRHEDLLDMLINEEAAPPLQLGCPEQHFHNDGIRPSGERANGTRTRAVMELPVSVNIDEFWPFRTDGIDTFLSFLPGTFFPPSKFLSLVCQAAFKPQPPVFKGNAVYAPSVWHMLYCMPLMRACEFAGDPEKIEGF
ncbi:hypothetical protein QQF64_007972 [Cirrhinus molitorella]|uniref:Uncharacterized protein n=1 Tax=Cirrhinus molitorella TaxID=172907 RepID=A0ABR3M5P4_9TELE